MSCIAQQHSSSGGEQKPRGYCYSDTSAAGTSTNSDNNIHHHHHHHTHLLQAFENNNNTEIYHHHHLNTAGMEIVGFPHKNNLQQQQSENWTSFFHKSSNHHHQHAYGGPGPSSSKPINEEASGNEFYHHYDYSKASDQSFMVSGFEDPSSLRCLFPNEKTNQQGLSLSLSSSNPRHVGFQSFELRQQQHHDDDSDAQGQFFNNQAQFLIGNSKYLAPAQELLNEFVSLRGKQGGDDDEYSTKSKMQKGNNNNNSNNQLQEDDNNNNATSSSSKQQQQILSTLDLLELQNRKAKLLQMLEEVDRRYRNYCEQMRGVRASFEAVAGNGAATVYSALASKAMSRHFRCLRDAIVVQIKSTRKAMGEKDTASPGTSRGETPRLRILDQTLRQQRAFQQMSMMESHPWRPQRGLPERSVSVLRAWLFEHFLHPYPNDVDKHILARQTGLSRSQVSNWFINARVRLWKPMVEEMYLEEIKDQEHNNALSDSIDVVQGANTTSAAATDDDNHGNKNQNHPQRQLLQNSEDQKPSHDQLLRIDSECLSSIIINHHQPTLPDRNNKGKGIQHDDHQGGYPLSPLPLPRGHGGIHHQHVFGNRASSSGIELDFSSYSNHLHFSNENAHHHHHHQRYNGGGGVSLTLGLQQHGGGSGVSLAFPPSQSSFIYPRDHIDEDCQTVQYSLLANDQAQNLPYRSLTGAQLLHDLAG